MNLFICQWFTRCNWKRFDDLWLFVLADLKGAYKDLEGTADARRIVLPMRRDQWGGQRDIQIVIRKDGMFNMTTRAKEGIDQPAPTTLP